MKSALSNVVSLLSRCESRGLELPYEKHFATLKPHRRFRAAWNGGFLSSKVVKSSVGSWVEHNGRTTLDNNKETTLERAAF